MRWLPVVALALSLIAVGVFPSDRVAGQAATLSLADVPAFVSANGPAFDVKISIAGVTNLGAYEWQLAFDPNVVSFVSAADGGFLGSTGRSVTCEPPLLPPSQDLQPGNVRFGCITIGEAGGQNGSGLLSSVRFQPVASGAPNIQFVCAGLADPLGEAILISNVPVCGSAVTPTPGPGETPAPTATPGPGETPAATLTPQPTATPTGPLPTPTPLPPGLEAIPLAAGCNPVASTYADATAIGTIAGAVGPAGNLISVWEFDQSIWRAFSPQFPEVSDLTQANFLDVLFACVGGPGAFVRPLV